MNKRVLVMISPMSAPRLGGIAKYAHEHGWHLMIQDRLGMRPLAWEGDGIITALRSDEVSVGIIRKLMQQGIPAVDVTISRPDVPIPRVTSDHREIGRIAARHFADRNFRRLAWFSTGWGHVQELRFAGFTENRRAERWVASQALPPEQKNSYAAFRRWLGGELQKAEKPLGVLTYDEADASRVLEVADYCKISVPEELAILSIGNDPIICENQMTPLSSVDQNLELGGYEAAALLDRLMNGEKAPAEPILIPSRGIVLRRSTDIIASSDPIAKRALAYIAENLATPFGAEQIADALDVPRNTLDKHFRADLARSVGDEIRRQRLAKAKKLLLNSDHTLASIAKETGFSSSSHLVNTFHAAFGQSPREFQKSVCSLQFGDLVV